MHNFKANYDKILEVLNQIEIKDNYQHQIRKPKLSDKELIAVNLTSEYFGIDSECHLFRLLPNQLSSRIERSVYNRRKRNLFAFQEQIRLKLARKFMSLKIILLLILCLSRFVNIQELQEVLFVNQTLKRHQIEVLCLTKYKILWV